MQLDARVAAVITGASGLGAATARRLPVPGPPSRRRHLI